MLHRCVVKVATMEDRLFRLDVDMGYLYRDVFSRWVDLAHDTEFQLMTFTIPDKPRVYTVFYY